MIVINFKITILAFITSRYTVQYGLVWPCWFNLLFFDTLLFGNFESLHTHTHVRVRKVCICCNIPILSKNGVNVTPWYCRTDSNFCSGKIFSLAIQPKVLGRHTVDQQQMLLEISTFVHVSLVVQLAGRLMSKLVNLRDQIYCRNVLTSKVIITDVYYVLHVLLTWRPRICN